MPDQLTVRGYRKSLESGTTTISATIGDFEVWFRGSELAHAPEHGDPFLAVALLPAMYAGTDLDLRDLPPVSARLLAALDLIQEIWTSWNPALSRIAIRAQPAAIEVPGSSRCATHFSGGVDAVHAALTGGAAGEELTFINGFDFMMTPAEVSAALDRLSRMAANLGFPLHAITTNWIEFTRRDRIARATSFGNCLHAVAHLVAPARMTIASAYGWDHLHSWGSHPLLDPLWSSDRTEIRHFGTDVWRSEKVAAIAQRPDLLADLWVCHTNPNRNCGRCNKCLRTMAVLQLLGAPLTSFLDPVTDPIGEYLDTVPRSAEFRFLEEFKRLAAAVDAPRRVRRKVAATERRLARRMAWRTWREVLKPGRMPARESTDLWPWGFGRPVRF